MSDTKFTPAPWVVDKDACIDKIAVRIGTAVESPYCRDVSDVWACDIEESENNANALANAHLIAAAPELYDLLQAIVSDIETEKELGGGGDMPLWASTAGLYRAKQLLAKARGE